MEPLLTGAAPSGIPPDAADAENAAEAAEHAEEAAFGPAEDVATTPAAAAPDDAAAPEDAAFGPADDAATTSDAIAAPDDAANDGADAAAPAAATAQSSAFARDLELARSVAAGDEAAFDRFYEANVERVFALCLRMCGDPEEARRLTQDAFVRAWERIGSYRAESRLSSWLHRVAANVVIESRRRRKRLRLRLMRDHDADDHPSRSRRDPGLRVDLERAIASLPDGARAVLVLRDVEGYSYAEIVELTGLAMGTVKAQIHRARKLVQQRLER